MNKKTEHNVLLDFVRLFAAIGILSHHAYLIGAKTPYFMMSGYMFVSLFFMISGYLTVKKLWNNDVKDISNTALSITINKIKRVYFFVIVVVILQYIYTYLTTKNFSTTSFMFESLLLYFIAPQKFNILLPHLWFLSSLFIALPIFTAFFLKFKNAFKNILCWIVPIFIFSYLMTYIGTLASWDSNLYFITSGLLLAIAGLFLGGCIYFLSEKLKKLNFTMFAKFLFTLIFILDVIFIIYFTSNYFQTNKDLITLISMFLLLLLTTSDITLINIPNGKFNHWVGRICLPLYIVHWLIANIINGLNLNISLTYKYGIYLIGSMIAAELLLLIQGVLLKKVKVKKLFIKND